MQRNRLLRSQVRFFMSTGVGSHLRPSHLPNISKPSDLRLRRGEDRRISFPEADSTRDRRFQKQTAPETEKCFDVSDEEPFGPKTIVLNTAVFICPVRGGFDHWVAESFSDTHGRRRIHVINPLRAGFDQCVVQPHFHFCNSVTRLSS